MYSNFGRALIGKKVGDEIRVKVGNGYLSYKIIGIK
ncbi:GreA/GreB family elongation factor [Clostridium culturomicium]